MALADQQQPLPPAGRRLQRAAPPPPPRPQRQQTPLSAQQHVPLAEESPGSCPSTLADATRLPAVCPIWPGLLCLVFSFLIITELP